VPDVFVSSGITRPFIVNWALLPGKQVDAYRQDATVVSLGMGDSRSIATPAGAAECCGEAWTAAYAGEVRRVMRTFSQRGRAAVVWLNEPFPRTPGSHERITAINTAIARAASGLPRVRVLDVARLLTPGGTFRETLLHRGRRIRVRERDGVHISRSGSRLVATTLIIPALVELGVLERR
jgi:hypothetical protein